MSKTELAPLSPQGGPEALPVCPKRRRIRRRTKINIALDKAEVAKMIDQIREEVEFHHGCAAEIKAKMEKLTSAALAELLRVKELKNIVESLKNNGHPATSAAGAQAAAAGQALLVPAAGKAERRKQELDRELEKLLIIKRLLEASLPGPAVKNGPPALPAANGPKKILVVDDDPTTVKIISHFLQRENYAVSISQSGIEGLKKAFKENPSLILLDIMMPDLNGFQFLSIYRKDEENARVPVVILSCLAEEADVLKGLDMGAVDYITKPFSPQVLLAKIKKNISSGP
jgi:CheY-like chemotaxis protein